MIQKKIEELLAVKKITEIETLELEKLELSSLDGLNNDLTNLTTLSLANNNLQSLDNFPNLPALTKLTLSGNKIETVDHLQGLKGCENLNELFLSGNPLTETDGYVKAVFDLLPQLTSVDGTSKSEVTNGDHEVPVNGDCDHAPVASEDNSAADEQDDAVVESTEVNGKHHVEVNGSETVDASNGDDKTADDAVVENKNGNVEDNEVVERGLKRKHEDPDPVATVEAESN